MTIDITPAMLAAFKTAAAELMAPLEADVLRLLRDLKDRDAALLRVCCKGEPHTCDQEAIAAAEGRTDQLIEQLAAMTAARDEACDGWERCCDSGMLFGKRIAELRAIGKEQSNS